MMQFAKAKHIYRIWNLFKRLLSASNERIAILEKILRSEDIGEDLLTITDAAYRVLAALDRNGRARFEVGLTSREATTEGKHEVKGHLDLRGTRLMESDDYGLFYVLDSEERILLIIDREGNTDFKGIPTDIKAALTALDNRIKALEK